MAGTPGAPAPLTTSFAEHVAELLRLSPGWDGREVIEVTVSHPPAGVRIHVRCSDGARFALGHVVALEDGRS